MQKLRERITFANGIIGEGLRMAVDVPRKYRLRVIRIVTDTERRAPPQAETTSRLRFDALHLDMQRPRGPILYIHFDASDPRGNAAGTAKIAIDLGKRRIDLAHSTPELFGKGPFHSGHLGVIAMTLPITLTLAPFLRLADARYRVKETLAGMSRHDLALFQAIKGQLDLATEAIVADALRRTWQRERKLARKLTASQAERLLSSCELFVDIITDEDPADDTLVSHRTYCWFDADGDLVAHGASSGPGDCQVDVLGSRFENGSATVLFDRCRIRTMLETHDPFGGPEAA